MVWSISTLPLIVISIVFLTVIAILLIWGTFIIDFFLELRWFISRWLLLIWSTLVSRLFLFVMNLLIARDLIANMLRIETIKTQFYGYKSPRQLFCANLGNFFHLNSTGNANLLQTRHLFLQYAYYFESYSDILAKCC